MKPSCADNGWNSADVAAHYQRLAEDYERRSNRTCKAAYREVIDQYLGGVSRVLEVGAGSATWPGLFDGSEHMVTDFSLPMLRCRPEGAGPKCAAVADGARLPFADGMFDGAFCVNLLEHVPAPERLVAEAGRVLRPGGRFVAITPNGDLGWLLALLERWHLKLPEGPHRFLSRGDMAVLGGTGMELVMFRRFVALPLGPWRLSRYVDRICPWSSGLGLFHYAVWEKSL